MESGSPWESEIMRRRRVRRLEEKHYQTAWTQKSVFSKLAISAICSKTALAAGGSATSRSVGGRSAVLFSTIVSTVGIPDLFEQPRESGSDRGERTRSCAPLIDPPSPKPSPSP